MSVLTSNVNDNLLSISTHVCSRSICILRSFCDALFGTAGYDNLKWISPEYEDFGCSVNHSMSSRILMVCVDVICLCVTLHMMCVGVIVHRLTIMFVEIPRPMVAIDAEFICGLLIYIFVILSFVAI